MAPLTDLEIEAWHAFLVAHHRVIRKLDEELMREHGLPLGSYEVLLFLQRAPGRCLKMSDLADRALLSPSGLTRMVDRLVRSGLVERVRATGDARSVHAHLTDEGMARFRLAARTHGRGIREHFSGRLDADQLGDLKRVLESLIRGCG